MSTLRTATITLSIALLCLAGIDAAVADDFLPPDFRGDPLYYLAEWDFATDFEPDRYNVLPDRIDFVGDGTHSLSSAFTHAHVSETVFWQTDPDDQTDGRAYTLGQAGQIDFFLANWTDLYDFKHIWIQITYGGQGVPFISGVNGPNPGDGTWTNPSVGNPGGTIEVDPNHRVEYWVLCPNPDREHVYLEIPPYTWVDQVLIETVSTLSPVENEEASWGEVKALYR